MIATTIIEESVKLIFSFASNKLKNANFEFGSTSKDLETSINKHIREVSNWSNEITFKDLKTAKKTQNVYIELDVFIYPRRIRINENEGIDIIRLKKIFEHTSSHVVLLGQPGAGKTTSMKFICQSIFFDEKYYPEKFKYPILIKLRDFNRPVRDVYCAGIIIEYLFNILGLKIKDINESSNAKVIIRLKERLVYELIDKLNVLIIIDGFDELVFKKHKQIVLEEISNFANQLENSRLILTSRTADYNYNFENIKQYEICPLNKKQIYQFAYKWLGSTSKAVDFIQAVEKSPFSDTTIRPLTIAHLCAIYERIGKIPDKPKTVYRKIINLLLEEWDEQRNIKRLSKYASFELDRKFEFLSCLAYNLTVSVRKTIFDKYELESTYKKICSDFDLNIRESKDVISELESHTGLFVQAGYELFEFAHKSLQEYLTAEYIVKLPFIPEEKYILERLPNELAIAISISSSSSQYFVEVIIRRFTELKLPFQFYQTFINRLLLEKPDFNFDSKVGIAALILYTIYLSRNTTDDGHGQLSLFIDDHLVNEFEGFIKEIFKRNSIERVFEKYEIIGSFLTMNNTNVLMLKFNKLKSEFDKDYPDNLYCRESFLNTIRKNTGDYPRL